MDKTEKISLLRKLFIYDKQRFLDPLISAECSMFYECDLYEVEDFCKEICRIIHVQSPFPQRKINVEYLQLTLF